MKRFLILLLPILFFSCSEKKSSADTISLVREIPAKSESHATALAKEASLSCEGFECIDGVGMFMATRSDALLTCTAFLIEKDIVVTNSHCLPAVVKDLPDLCSSKIQILFPKGKNAGEEKIACKELLGFSERPNAISPDIALIKLERSVNRKPIEVSRMGIHSASPHSAIKVNPGLGPSGILVKQDCVLVEKNYRLPLFDNPFSRIFVTGDCSSQAGNSGAPLLNAKGEAVGIFQAELPYTDRQRQAWQPHLLSGETFAPLAMGTNLFCLESNSRFLWNPLCETIDEESIQRPKISDFDFSAEIFTYRENIPEEHFRWEIKEKTKTLERTIRFTPLCVNSLPKDAFSLKLPVLQAKIYFNRYLQVQARLQKIADESVTYSVAEKDKSYTLSASGEESREIPLCREGLL